MGTMLMSDEVSLVALHAPPRWGAVLRQQLRSVRYALRPETIALFGGMVVFAALGIFSAIQQSHAPGGAHNLTNYVPQQSGPYGLFALFLPFAVWKSDNPSRRAYHLAMPAAQGPHTLAKLLAGWSWTMVGAACYLLFLMILLQIISAITGSAVHFLGTANAWGYLTPFTAATVMYLLGSMMAISVDHPWRWALLVFVVVPMSFPMLGGFHETVLRRVMEAVFIGRYGLMTATLGFVPMNADGMQRWLVGTALWVSVGLGASMLAACWRRDT